MFVDSMLFLQAAPFVVDAIGRPTLSLRERRGSFWVFLHVQTFGVIARSLC